MSAPCRRPMPRPLRRLYGQLNGEFFAGRLPPTIRPGVYGRLVADRIVVMRSGRWLRGPHRQRGVGRYTPANDFCPHRIVVVGGLNSEHERRVLLHEMIHADLYLGGDRDAGHGPRFVAELERLGALGEAWAAAEATHLHAEPPA